MSGHGHSARRRRSFAPRLHEDRDRLYRRRPVLEPEPPSAETIRELEATSGWDSDDLDRTTRLDMDDQ